VAHHLRARVPALTRRAVARLRSELPVYAQLPAEELSGDIADIVQRTLRLYADAIERRRPASEAELGRQRESAAQRAEEGVPLDAILTAYHLGTAMCWEEVAAGAVPGDLPDLQELFGLTLAVQRQLSSAVSGAYLQARQILDGEEHRGRHALMAALLAGEPPAGPGAAALYVAATLVLDPHPDESAPGARAAIASRRKVRRVRTVLDEYAEPLTALDSAGGTVLLPVAAAPPWPDLCGLVSRAGRAAGTPVTAAAEVVEPAAIPAAVARNGEVVALVRRTGRPPGLYRLADVLLDYQLTRPSEALPALAALLEPLAGRPDLLDTLESYVSHALDRRTTAASLHVHPNTVDYRLRRITVLTGLHPGRPADLQYLNAALLARRWGAA
jgi:PucR C-terminal helix-turn-helix domain